MIGPLGLSLAMFSFGLSNNFWLLVLSRAFQGIFNGNLGECCFSMFVQTDYQLN